MAARQISERIVDVLSVCSEDPMNWPAELRGDCSLIHARYQALKIDASDARAWRLAKAEWVRNKLKESGMARIVYHFRDCAPLRG